MNPDQKTASLKLKTSFHDFCIFLSSPISLIVTKSLSLSNTHTHTRTRTHNVPLPQRSIYPQSRQAPLLLKVFFSLYLYLPGTNTHTHTHTHKHLISLFLSNFNLLFFTLVSIYFLFHVYTSFFLILICNYVFLMVPFSHMFF